MKLAIIDTESTGFEPGSRLVELAAVICDADGNVDDEFCTLANPGMPIPPDVTAVHGITDDMVADAPHAATAITRLLDELPRDVALVIHNAPYDVALIEMEAARRGVDMPQDVPVYDSLALARALRETGANSLPALCGYHGIEVEGDAHRALCDARAVHAYWRLRGDRYPDEPKPWSSLVGNARYLPPSMLPNYLSSLPNAVATGGTLAFGYTDAKGETTERAITPYGWARTPKGITVHGLCALRGERRTFYVERMRAASVSAEVAA